MWQSLPPAAAFCAQVAEPSRGGVGAGAGVLLPPRGWGCRRLGVASHLGPWAPRGAVSHSCAGETLWAPTEDGQNLASSISRELPEPVNPCIAERGGTPANILEDLVMIDASEKHYPKQFPHDLGSQRHFETL